MQLRVVAQPPLDKLVFRPIVNEEQRTNSFKAGEAQVEWVTTTELLSWAPATSYRVDTYNAGPAAAASITFKHGNTAVRMIVTCAGGVPSATTS